MEENVCFVKEKIEFCEMGVVGICVKMKEG
jgi:hypothetical protein